ncbi:Cytochrome c [Rubripirellula amarantea]|uniref:Cytochrome c n=1 Tax=Rubripirellula amarantea TaxID=2527999 RepID=A0A5C5WC79_9BACT|nr:c-type cytochrome [Rubripirellula amarantea]TWT48137.1 Cytochrome c [Rubripirellula amarantea]
MPINPAANHQKRFCFASAFRVYALTCLLSGFAVSLPATWAAESQAKNADNRSLIALVQTLQTVQHRTEVCRSLLRGMLKGYEGQRNVTSPPGWHELSASLRQNEDREVRDLSLRLSQIFGDQTATEQALAILRDPSADEEQRRTSLRSLLNQQNVEASQYLETLLNEENFALDAIRGFAIVANQRAPDILLKRYAEFSPELRRATIETLASRKDYALELLEAIKNEQISRNEIPSHVARSLSDLLGDHLGDDFAKVFGEIRLVAKDREKVIAKYKAMLTPSVLASADASKGRAVFQKTCAACHLLYGVGGDVGPDLTGSNRANLDYILLNSIAPSFDVPDAYRMIQILTFDGRIISGVLAEENAIRLVLKTPENSRVIVAKDDIDTRRVAPKSMMPEGQLEQMEPQEVIDLIKYLQTTEQVEIAK